MRKQALVIGLGQFGMALAQSLTERGVEVLASDLSEERVRMASTFAAEAVCFDATDEEALVKSAPERRDICVCSIGTDSGEASIICTALLRQMGAKRVVARANTPLQERILRLVGAHDVVNPEREFGDRYANLLVYEGLLGELPLGEDLVISEFRPPEVFLGHTLMELALPRRFGVTVVALRKEGINSVSLPKPKETLKPEDILVVVARPGTLGNMLEQI